MLRKYRIKTYRGLFGATILTSVYTVIKVVSNIIVSKFLAVYAGPAGMTLLGQMSNFTSMVLPLSTLGVNSGVVKYTSEYKEDSGEVAKIISTTAITILYSSLFTMLGVLLFSNQISLYFFGSEQYKNIILLTTCSIPLYAFYNFILSIVNGLGSYQTFTKLNIYSSVFSLVLSVIFICFWASEGALLSVIFSQSLIFFVSLFYIVRYKDKFPQKWSIDKIYLKKILAFSFMALVTAALAPTSQILLRTMLINATNIETAGLWDAANRISSMYLLVITTTIGTYFIPLISKTQNISENIKQIKSAYAMLLPLTIVLCICIYSLLGWIIKIFLSEAFYTLEDFYYIQIIGDFFKIAAWILGYTLMAKAIIKEYIIIEVISTITLIIFAFIFINNISPLEGICLAYLINNILLLFFYFFVLAKKVKANVA